MHRKPVFRAVRAILRRSFQQHEVERLDPAIDCAQGDEEACASLPARRVGPQGIALIKRFEGCAKIRRDGRVEAYPDPGTGGEPWTIGWGATGTGIVRGTVWTQEQCDARLEAGLWSVMRPMSRVRSARRQPAICNSMRW